MISIIDSVIKPIQLYCGNISALLFSKDNKSIIGSKHVEVKHLTVKELVKKGDVAIDHIEIENMIVDPLTKGFSPSVFV